MNVFLICIIGNTYQTIWIKFQVSKLVKLTFDFPENMHSDRYSKSSTLGAFALSFWHDSEIKVITYMVLVYW